MVSISPIENYPLSSKSALASQYVGQRLQDLPTPALVLDRSKLKKNTAAMLQVCQKLNVGFRAHVKSHKTLELSILQVGETGPANFIVSTVIEAENLLPFVVESQKKRREASVCDEPTQSRSSETLIMGDRFSMVSLSLNRPSPVLSIWPSSSALTLST